MQYSKAGLEPPRHTHKMFDKYMPFKEKTEMKNVIPLVVSVILGLAAVFVVSKTLFDRDETKDEEKISIITAARDIPADEELTEGSLTYRNVPKSVLPHGALLWKTSQ